MIDSGKMGKLNLAYEDMTDDFSSSYKAASRTETITLDPSAKVVKYDDIVQMRDNEGKAYRDNQLSQYAASKGEGCEALFKIQTGQKVENSDFDKVLQWQAQGGRVFARRILCRQLGTEKLYAPMQPT